MTRRFAFLVHPLVPVARVLHGLRAGRPGITLGSRDGTDPDDVAVVARMGLGDVEGVVVSVPMLPAQLLADQQRALRCMERAVQLAAPVQFVGLGSVLAVVAGRGKELEACCGIPVTTGNAATAWAAASVARRVAGQRRVAVLGARGAVGRALVELLGADADPAELGAYEVVVGAHTTGGVLDPARLHPRATLVDVALPPTLAAPAGPGATVLAGESVRLPAAWRRDAWSYIFHLAAGYGLRHVYACLLEPYLALRTGRREAFAQGRVLDVAAVRALGAAAEAEGFVPEARRLRVGHAVVSP